MFEAEGDDIQPRGQTSAELTGDEDGPFVLVDEAQCSAPTSPELHQEFLNKDHRLDKKSSINQKKVSTDIYTRLAHHHDNNWSWLNLIKKLHTYSSRA